MAIASYNAGPGNVANWVERYGLKDLDVFVEQIPFKETKGYVEAVFANYWNYERLYIAVFIWEKDKNPSLTLTIVILNKNETSVDAETLIP